VTVVRSQRGGIYAREARHGHIIWPLCCEFCSLFSLRAPGKWWCDVVVPRHDHIITTTSDHHFLSVPGERVVTTRHNALQHTAAHGSTLQHAGTHDNTLQHAGTHSRTQKHTATHDNTRQHKATHGNARQRTATHGNARQRTATHRNTLT